MKPLILPPWSAAELKPRPEPLRRAAATPIHRSAATAGVQSRYRGEEPPRRAVPTTSDDEYRALSFLDSLDGQEWLRLVLWGALGLVLLWAIVSFFSAPLMGPDIVIVSGLLGALLAVSYTY